jgi:beta-N-acetylhexosaminidase
VRPRVVIGLALLITAIVVLIASAALLVGCDGDTSVGSTTGPTASLSSSTTSTSTTAVTSSTTLLSKAEAILRRMNLREKAAQVLLLALDGTTLLPDTRELLLESPPGGLLLLSRNVSGVDQLRSLTAAAQEVAAEGGSEVGLFIAVDQEGGSVQRIRLGVPPVPAARALGDGLSVAEARRLAAETAMGLLELGVNMNLAPVADVVSDPDSFLYQRTYGGDPTVVADFVGAVTEAFVQNGLVVVVKHFPGHGSAPGDTHGEMVVSNATEADFTMVHLPPFSAALSAGAECVMMAHIVVSVYDPRRPASLSARVVQGVLREGLDFSGVVVADDLEMAGAAFASSEEGAYPGLENDPGELAVLALQAGCDLLISTGTLSRQTAMIDAIVEAVRSGRLSQSRLDEAVRHMLDIKLRHGLVAPSPAP